MKIYESKELIVNMRQLDFTNQTNYEIEWTDKNGTKKTIVAWIGDVRLPCAVRDICRQFLNERKNDE